MIRNKTVSLTAAEQKICRTVAQDRYDAARKMGTVDAKHSDASNATVDLEGVAAELAFCKLFNVYPLLEVWSVAHEDQGDVSYNGMRIDVKSTVYQSGHLIAALSKKPNSVDAYALMVGNFPTYRFCGFMRSAELIRPERVTTLAWGKSPAYAASQHELTDQP